MPRPIAVLTSTTDKLQAYGSGAAATTNPTVTVLYHDIPQEPKTDFAEYKYGRQYTVLDGATETDILAAPLQHGVVRVVDRIVVYNADTANFTVFVAIDDNTTNRIQVRKTLATLESLVGDEEGWDAVTGVFATGVTSTQVLYSSSGVATGSANMTFNGTTLTAHTLTVSTGTLTASGGISTTTLSTSGNATLGDNVADAHTITGAVSITDDNAAGALSIIATTGDRLIIAPQAATAGVYILSRNVGNTDYEPIDIRAESVTLSYGSSPTAGITLSSAGNTTLAGTLTVSGNTLSGSGAGTLRADGGIRIGADSTNGLLDDASTGAGSTTLYIGNASVNVTSDERVKTNVRVWDGDASKLLITLPVKQFGYLSNAPMGGYEGEYVGFTAQDLHAVAPWAVNTQGDTNLPWAARYEFLTGIMVKGWQEHEARLKALETRKTHD